MTKSTTRRFLCCLLALCCLLGSLTAFSLAAGTGFVLFGAPLASFIYRDAEVGEYVRILGFVAPFMYLESMVDGVLKGLGEQLATFYYSLADSILKRSIASLPFCVNSPFIVHSPFSCLG